MKIQRRLLLAVFMMGAAPVAWSGGNAHAATNCNATVGSPVGEYASVGGREVRYGIAGWGSLTCDRTAILLAVAPCIQAAEVLAPDRFFTIAGGCSQGTASNNRSVYAHAWAQCVPAVSVLYRTRLDFVVQGDASSGYTTGAGYSPQKEISCSVGQSVQVPWL